VSDESSDESSVCCLLWYGVQDVRGDIFAFGLCMLELLTLKQLDPQHCMEVPQLLTQVGSSRGREGWSAAGDGVLVRRAGRRAGISTVGKHHFLRFLPVALPSRECGSEGAVGLDGSSSSSKSDKVAAVGCQMYIGAMMLPAGMKGSCHAERILSC
jgi:hypothetical protein